MEFILAFALGVTLFIAFHFTRENRKLRLERQALQQAVLRLAQDQALLYTRAMHQEAQLAAFLLSPMPQCDQVPSQLAQTH